MSTNNSGRRDRNFVATIIDCYVCHEIASTRSSNFWAGALGSNHMREPSLMIS